MGMGTAQVVTRAELPLALPLLMTGVRTATVQVVATAGLAALVGGGGLGTLINLGFGQQDYGLMIAGAILVAALALLVQALLSVVSWAVTPGPRRLPFRGRRPAAAVPEEPAAVGVPL
jgi:osmoprotectant transport system permease protein